MSTIFGGNTGLSYDDIKRKRAIANAMMLRATKAPRNVGEGLTAIGNALMVRKLSKDADASDKANRKKFDDQWGGIMAALGGGGGFGGSANAVSSAPDPHVNFKTNLGKSGPAPSVDKYPVGESAIDPETRLMLARTLQAEAGNQGLDGMLDVGSVISNRANAGGRYGKGIPGVIMKPGQFSAWNSKTGYAGGEQGQNMNFQPGSNAMAAADAILRGQHVDQTGGATHYYNPAISKPRWGNASFKARGDHVFGFGDGDPGGRGSPSGVAGTGSSPTLAGGSGMDQAMLMKIAEIANSPYASAGEKAVLNSLIQRQMQASDPLRQLQLKKGKLELDQLENPKRETKFVDDIGLIDTQTGQVISDFDGAVAPEAEGTEYGLTPQYAVTEDGTLAMIQLAKDGTAKRVKMPEGMALQKGLQKLDLGTHFQWYNSITAEPIGGAIPKNLGAAEEEKAAGRARGQAEVAEQQAAPRIIDEANAQIALIESVIDDPALPNVLGKFQGRLNPEGLGGLFMSQAGLNLLPKIKQISGKEFLAAFERLKGGGQITEREGQAALDAATRLQRYQDDDSYKEALNELLVIAKRAKLRAKGVDIPEFGDLPDDTGGDGGPGPNPGAGGRKHPTVNISGNPLNGLTAGQLHEKMLSGLTPEEEAGLDDAIKALEGAANE